MKAQHTPGPWHVGMKPGPIVYGPNGEQVASLVVPMLPEEENRANAHLIAAAPELLAALRDVIGWIPGSSAWHTDAARKSVENARAVLAQATGAES